MQRDDYRATLIVMFGLAASTLTGFLRQAALANQLGASRAADIYLVAFAVPEFVFIALPIVFSPAFIPVFTEWRQRRGETTAWSLSLRVTGALLLFLLALTAVAGLGAPLYLTWLSPGFNATEQSQAVQITYLMLPALALMGLVTVSSTVLQVYRRFAGPALATAVYNVVFVVTLLALPLSRPLDRAAWSVTLGAAAALLFQLPLLWRRRSSPVARETPQDDGGESPLAGVGQVARLAGPLLAGYAVHHLILFIDRAMATTLGAGSAAALNYADRLTLVVGQVSGLAVSIVLFPNLAEQVGRGETAKARDSLAGALRLVWMIALPACVGMILLRTPLVRVLFERGAFDRAATAAVGGPLVWYALSVLADALCQPLWRVVYVQRRSWTVLAVNGLQTVIRLLGNIILSGWFGYNGLALSAALGLSAQAVVLGWLVHRRLGAFTTGGWWRGVAKVTLATAIMAALVYWLAARLLAAPPVLTLLACGVVGGLVYLIILQFPRYLKKWNLAKPIR